MKTTGYLTAVNSANNNSADTQYRAIHASNSGNHALFVEYFQCTDELLTPYRSAEKPILLRICARVIDTLEELLEEIKKAQPQESKVPTLTYLALKKLIYDMKENFIEPCLKEQVAATRELQERFSSR